MLFRNLTIFRFPTSLDLSQLDERLAACALKPVGPLQMSSQGFIPPLTPRGQAPDLLRIAAEDGEAFEPLSHRIDDALWLSVGSQDKLLPVSVVNELLQKKLARLQQKQGHKIGAQTRKRMREDALHELLPRAFVRSGRTDAILDLSQGLCVVDSSSRKSAENVVGQIRRALGSFPALPLNAAAAPRAVLTGWIAGEPLPRGLSLGEECELKDGADYGAVVKCQRQDLGGEEIAAHLESGKQVTQLALVLDERVGFVLGEDLMIRKLKSLDSAQTRESGIQPSGQPRNRSRSDVDDELADARAELETRFVLMAGELKRLFAILEPALKLSRADA